MTSRTPVRLVCALILVLCPAAMAGCGGAGSSTDRQSSETAPTVEILRADRSRDSPSAAAREDVAQLVQGNTAFACDLFKTSRSATENFLISPYAVSRSLAMTYAGAAGETERAMADTLRFSLPGERVHPAFNALDAALRENAEAGETPVTLTLASSLWGQRDFTYLPDFLDRLAADYDVGLRVVDFGRSEASRKAINDWASEATAGRVKEATHEFERRRYTSAAPSLADSCYGSLAIGFLSP